jgi:hypothetical protein
MVDNFSGRWHIFCKISFYKKETFIKENEMTAREAIRILMESPFYFKMEIMNRLVLVKEYCLNYSAAASR